MSAAADRETSIGFQASASHRDGHRRLRYDAERHRYLRGQLGAGPSIDNRGQPRGSGLGGRRSPVERSNAWGLENKRLAFR
jgi:hypothetical protein